MARLARFAATGAGAEARSPFAQRKGIILRSESQQRNPSGLHTQPHLTGHSSPDPLRSPVTIVNRLSSIYRGYCLERVGADLAFMEKANTAVREADVGSSDMVAANFCSRGVC
jgi:hypothetical protein